MTKNSVKQEVTKNPEILEFTTFKDC